MNPFWSSNKKMKTKTSVTKVSKDLRFLGSDDPQDIFTTLYPHETMAKVWMCTHIRLAGEWGFEEEFILANIIREEKQEKQEAA